MVGNFACEGLEFRSLNGVAEAGQALTCFLHLFFSLWAQLPLPPQGGGIAHCSLGNVVG